MTFRSCLSIGISVVACLSQPVQAGTPFFRGLGDLPGGTFESRAFAISSDAATVVGQGQTLAGPQAFRWNQQGGIVGLGDLPGGGVNSLAAGVSGDGSVVVGSSDSALGFEAFRWTAITSKVGLGDFVVSPLNSAATGVSGDGTIVVGYGSATDASSEFQAFRWTMNTGLVGLGGLNSVVRAISHDGSVIVGAVSGSAFRWTESEGMLSLSGIPGRETGPDVATAVSFDGSVIVGADMACDEGNECSYVAFRWTQATGMVPLSETGGTWASGVSGNGSIVVGYTGFIPGGSPTGSFIWDVKNGLRNLQTVFAVDHGLNLNKWSQLQVNGISANGRTLVGHGRFQFLPNRFRTEAWMAHIGIAGDVDGDDRADLHDFFLFWPCMNGPGAAAHVNPCPNGDADFDGDVDLRDFAAFQSALPH